MKNYQLSYASLCDKMYDKKSREEKAKRIIKTLADFYGTKPLNQLNLLDIASSTGIIAYNLAKKFKSVTGADIDKEAIEYAKSQFHLKNLKFVVDDGLNLKFKDSTFDVVIATHVYEHVADPEKLFNEIFRVLKPGGVCYLAAVNKLWPIEQHYHLPFLGLLPKSLANLYVSLFKRANSYYETPLSYWELLKLTRKFKVKDYTPLILRDPEQFGYKPHSLAVKLMSPVLKYLVPTFFWVLVKE